MATTPFDNFTTLSNDQFRAVTQLKLLLSTTNIEDGPMQCPTCKQNSTMFLKGTVPPVPVVDSYGDHSTSCKDASGSLRTKHWHDPQVRVWFYLMRAAGFRCETEKRGIVVSSGKRPDIVIFGAGPNKGTTHQKFGSIFVLAIPLALPTVNLQRCIPVMQREEVTNLRTTLGPKLRLHRVQVLSP
jgi:hypothetical protein